MTTRYDILGKVDITKPKKTMETECYKIKIEKFDDKSYRIYCFNPLEKGGDTEILVRGDVVIHQEIVGKDKSGIAVSLGFKRVDF